MFVVCVLIIFTTGMDESPTFPQLLKFGNDSVNIIEGIGNKYHEFGIKLLEDGNGCKMATIEMDNHGHAAINNVVLRRWFRGEGRKPISWATLAGVLQECCLTVLADEIHSD